MKADSPAYPLVYAHLRTKLEESKFPSDKLEATLEAELLDHMVASHDVGGTSATYVMYQLSQHPALQSALRLELRQHSPESVPSAWDLDSLPLLDAIIMETLRLHPGNPGPWPRYTAAGNTCVG